ncbi:MAG TPA: hypothetical protein VFB63_17660, partial [Bryobacteraceae bacterium]|nr:hypothetical protein [Bryobacteraceae bacterium]
METNKVKIVYYTILAVYFFWGLVALRITPNPLVLAIATGVMWNFALGFTALHTLAVLRRLLPQELKPGLFAQFGLIACAVFYFGISGLGFWQQWPKVAAWLGTLF